MDSIALDSSTLISLSQSCLVGALDFLSSKVKGRFIIPPAVRHEIVVHPMHVRRYSFSALRMGRLLQKNVIQVIEPPGIEQKAKELAHLANNLLFVHGRPIQLIQEGETQCLALLCLNQAGAIAVDEKTTRLLLEAPSVLLERTASEYRSNVVGFNQKNLRAWNALMPRVSVLRSAELIAIAARRGYFREYGELEEQAMQSAIASVRNAGCSLTEKELDEYSVLEK